MQDKRPHNKQGQQHGYWEMYLTEETYIKVSYIYGEMCGYCLTRSGEYIAKTYYAR